MEEGGWGKEFWKVSEQDCKKKDNNTIIIIWIIKKKL